MTDHAIWWRQARLGMFIHWGLYALPAGQWQGRAIPGVAEWIMKRAAIPLYEYEALAARFNPQAFDADAIARLAADAGMAYVVFTAKHHDGFALYRSRCDGYNIVDATPFGRDPLAALAGACARRGLKLGLYYSHVQDWHDPDALGNDWDFPATRTRDFDAYMARKALPQMEELLTGYGPLGLIWYDTPYDVTREQSRAFVDVVRRLQPGCLVNGRVGYGLGDYESMGDNMTPAHPVAFDWETPATLNDSWGYKAGDENWKSPAELVRRLAQINARGGNYLLNVGPDGLGRVPEGSAAALAALGRWMGTYGEAIRGTHARPDLFYRPDAWGEITAKGNKLYLIAFAWPGDEIELFGIKTPVTSARLLGRDAPLVWRQADLPAYADYNRHRIIVDKPAGPRDDIADVVELTFDGPPGVASACRQSRHAGL